MIAAADELMPDLVVTDDTSTSQRPSLKRERRAATLEQLARLCQTGSNSVRTRQMEASGFTSLDAALPGGGWQTGSMVEIMPDDIGIGELRLIMPTLARITHSDRHVALISPPHIPFAAALAQQGLRLEQLLIIRADKPIDALWACEQTLRCRSFGAVIAWPVVIKDRDIRRLQLAAEAGHSIGFLYRLPSAAMEASPAATRLRLHSNPHGLSVDILKCRGGRAGQSVVVNANSSMASTATESAATTVLFDPATVAADSPTYFFSDQMSAVSDQ